jgi:hypothetical protein
MVFGFLRNFFGGLKRRRYSSLEKYLSGKISPSSSEGSIRSQLTSISSSMPEKQRKALDAYISSGVWKDAFVKKQ